MFSCEFCGIFKNTFFTELFRATTSDSSSSKKETLCHLWKRFCILRKLENHPKNLPNLKNLEGKYLWQSFVYSQTTLLWFTVILFHIDFDEKVTRNEQKVTSNEQRATNKKFNLRVDRGWWILCQWLTLTLYVRDSLEDKSMLFIHFYLM